MKELFGGKTIKSRIILYNFCMICVISIIFSVSSYMTANIRTMEIARNSIAHHVENMSYQFQMAYEEMINIILICTERKDFNLEGLGDDSLSADAGTRGLEYYETIADLCAVSAYDNYILKLSLVSADGAQVQTGNSIGSSDDYRAIFGSSWIDSELQKSMDSYFLDLAESPFYRINDDVLPIVRPLSGDPSKDEGLVMLVLSTGLYSDILRKTSNGQEVVVVTRTGGRIASVNEPLEHQSGNDEVIRSLLESDVDKGFLETEVNGKKSLVAYERHVKSGILVYETVPLGNFTNDRVMLLQTIIVLFGGCLVLGLILSVIFTNQVKKPIDRLVSYINRIALGEFIQDPSVVSEDEIGTIGKVVNGMSSQIDGLMKQRMEDEQEKSRLELKMLQAQINPHFLYNTLDSIKWIAVIQKSTGIVKVVTALSGLLKNMAKGFNEKVTLEKELDFLNDYVTIEKVKYVELFDLKITVEDPQLYQAKVIKLTLQPLVENAIFSGIEPAGRHGTIQIHVYTKDQDLLIHVRDDGVGIRPQKLTSIFDENDSSRHKEHMSGIGLPNVDRRIKLTYGDAYGLSIESEVGSYTQITVRIPIEY